MSLYYRGVWGVEPRAWPTLFAFAYSKSRHCNRATPAIFPAVIRGYPMPTIMYSTQGFRVILQIKYPKIRYSRPFFVPLNAH